MLNNYLASKHKFLKVINCDEIKDYWWFEYMTLMKAGNYLLPSCVFSVFAELCRKVEANEVSIEAHSKEVYLTPREKIRISNFNLLRIGFSEHTEPILYYDESVCFDVQ